MSDEKFYVLWCPTYPTPPKKKYDTKEQADAVARAMATKQPGDEFNVLECVATYSTPKPEVVKVERKETKKEREAREANLAKEKEFLEKQAATKGTWVGAQARYESGAPKPSTYQGITGPMTNSEADAARARSLIGKRVRLTNIDKVYPEAMLTQFAAQVGPTFRAKAVPWNWRGQKPAYLDCGVVVDAGTVESPSNYNQWRNLAPGTEATRRFGPVAVVVNLDKGISCVVDVTAVKELTGLWG